MNKILLIVLNQNKQKKLIHKQQKYNLKNQFKFTDYFNYFVKGIIINFKITLELKFKKAI